MKQEKDEDYKKLLGFAKSYPKHAIVFIKRFEQNGEPMGEVYGVEGEVLNLNTTLTGARVIADYKKAELVIEEK